MHQLGHHGDVNDVDVKGLMVLKKYHLTLHRIHRIHLSLHGSRRRKKLLLKRASFSGTGVVHLCRSVLFVREHESIDAWVHDFEIKREVNPLVVSNNLLYLFVCR